MVIAIDGPAGSGKSTTARRLAERLGFAYLDTGAMYRVLTWIALRDGIDLDNGAALSAAGANHDWTVDHGKVMVDGIDVTLALREARVDRSVSRVATHAEVREFLRERQRAAAETGNVVIEGRDIGTVVCPDAAVKVFLTADEGERARRRGAERPVSEATTLASELRRRDEADAEQSRRAPDAITIDTTALDLDQVVESMARLVEAAIAGQA